MVIKHFHRTVLTKRKWPGPHAAGGLPWAGNPSFFDVAVQRILSRRKGHLGWPITCWEIIERVTRRHNPIYEHGFSSPAQPADKEKEQQLLRNRWAEFANCYNSDPDFVAPLFAAMTSFHAIPPKEWPLALKVACLSVLAEYEGKVDTRRPVLPLRNPRKAEMLKKWFGNEKIGPERISIEISRERKRRLRIHTRWQNHYDYLNEQIDKRFLTHTSSSK